MWQRVPATSLLVFAFACGDSGVSSGGNGGSGGSGDGGALGGSDVGGNGPGGGPAGGSGGSGGAPTCDFAFVEGQDMSVPTEGGPRPALNEVFQDEHYGLLLARVTDASQVTDHDLPSWVRHEYARRPAFNSDSSRAIMISSNGWLRLYDVLPNGTLEFDKTLDIGEPQEPNWHPTDPSLIYFFSSYGSGFTISTYDITTDETEVTRDLEAAVAELIPAATGMWTKQEGRPSHDGRIWCLEVGHTTQPNSEFVADGLIAYDLETDTILGHMETTTSPDHISTSPNGTYCVPSWGLPLGTRAYTADFSSFTQLHDRSEHSDLAVTKDGNEVLVYTAYDGEDAGNVVMVHLDDGAATPLFPLYGANHSGTSFHISGTSKDKPGYVVVSTYGCFEDYGNADCDPSTQWFYDKVLAVELAADPTLYNLAHVHYGDAGYFAETQAVANADLSRVLFVSSWESDNEDDVSSYMIQVPSCALP